MLRVKSSPPAETVDMVFPGIAEEDTIGAGVKMCGGWEGNKA